MARVTVRRTFDLARDFDRAVPDSLMRECGEELASKIENRTLSGLDENNRRFAPYNPEYQRRQKFGRATVDLHLSGRMFSDFAVVKATRKAFSLGFTSARSADLARYHDEGTRRMPQRKFLGVPTSWITEIRHTIARSLKF